MQESGISEKFKNGSDESEIILKDLFQNNRKVVEGFHTERNKNKSSLFRTISKDVPSKEEGPSQTSQLEIRGNMTSRLPKIH